MKKSKKIPFIAKEISWLSFNARVLQEADDHSVPLLERLRFLGIYANNLDEFFRVRVALLRRLVLTNENPDAEKILGGTPAEILKQVQSEVFRQSKQFSEIQEHLKNELAESGVVSLKPSELTPEQLAFVRTDFQKRVRHHLFPIMFSTASEIPNIDDSFAHLVVVLQGEKKDRYAVIKIPSDKISRFTVIPSETDQMTIVLLDDIIRVGLSEIFTPFEFNKIKAYCVKITKDAELDITDDISETYRDMISKSVKARKKGELVRFEYDKKMPDKLIEWFKKRYKISRLEVMIAGGRFRGYQDFLNFPQLNVPNSEYQRFDTIVVPHLTQSKQILNQIRERDVLLHYPYHSFDIFVQFLREASIDPRVDEIRITLYRMSSDSAVANALINAAINGKKVVVTLELQARFDEENNLYWSEKMSEAGVRVIHGVPGMKVHAKLCYFRGKEKGEPVSWAAVGTGNFNERTSTRYTDVLLMTSNNEICTDAQQIFEFLDRNYLHLSLKQLQLSPYDLRSWLIKKIDTEIANAEAGKPASISAKLNQLVDIEIQEKLVEAAQAGVVIRLLIRGMCGIAPKPRGNFEIRRVVDRFLEHSRFVIFHNDGSPEVSISSADWMVRNLDRRIEVTAPVLEQKLKQQFIDIFEIYWQDNQKAVYVEPSLSNCAVECDNGVRAQYEMVNYLGSL